MPQSHSEFVHLDTETLRLVLHPDSHEHSIPHRIHCLEHSTEHDVSLEEPLLVTNVL